MGTIDLVAVIVVCVTVLAIYVLERKFLAVLRTDAAEHAQNALASEGRAEDYANNAVKARLEADACAQRAFQSAERAQAVVDKGNAKIEGRLASLEARR